MYFPGSFVLKLKQYQWYSTKAVTMKTSYKWVEGKMKCCIISMMSWRNGYFRPAVDVEGSSTPLFFVLHFFLVHSGCYCSFFCSTGFEVNEYFDVISLSFSYFPALVFIVFSSRVWKSPWGFSLFLLSLSLFLLQRWHQQHQQQQPLP